MTETTSRISVFLVAVPSLLLFGLIGLMVAAYGWRIEPEPLHIIVASQRPERAPRAAGAASVPSAQVVEDSTSFQNLCGPYQPLRMDEEASVAIVECPHPIRLSYRNLEISVRQRPFRDGQVPESVVTFRRHGRPPQRIVVSAAEIGDLNFRVGRLDRSGFPYIMVRSFTAGNHCCIGVNLAIPEGPDRGTVELGYFEVAMVDRLEPGPTDIDGDGRTDFVVRDERFYYEFSSYSGTADPPLRIWNIRRGRAIEVSGEPRYRAAFEEDLAGRRAECLQGGEAVPYTCPAYVAAAARLGRFRTAWRDMMSVYEPGRDDLTIYEHLPHHLRRFLRARGYLRT